ncbi:hypothetical protein THASP1DRAFT_26219 [Thamnocephalis sphaerospora]|uniref:F-box domain-containing protein n=1 Tax=Thamnocephalis sphaerospora TaxID=78915 RepID=A0A4P9XIR3_9FUNG|nr:hypothetical protein THASP1DRAFT_26219 [Thamnocephalis sphaerospora]|eukprot:RKP05251.1 hypothetical protein THASP1DRAFT_26219 [Thamnocephalis sphaerospora]
MNRIPNEVLDYIIWHSDDEASLLTLSRASRKLRVRVSSHQSLWRKRVEQQFTLRDDNELKWWRLYTQTCKTALPYVDSSIGADERTANGNQVDWFDVYCKRRAVEYRQRHGLYTAYRFDAVASTCPNGVRLQILLYAYHRLPVHKMFVASRWWLTRQQRLTWILERPCWKGVDIRRLQIYEYLQSDEYLIVRVMHLNESVSPLLYSLYAWHVPTLHKPPCAIVTKQWITSTSVRADWLLIHHRAPQTPSLTMLHVYNLNSGENHPGPSTSRQYTFCHIQRATAEDVHIICMDDAGSDNGSTMVSYRLYQSTLDCAEKWQFLAALNARVDNIRTAPQRVDDSRFIIWTSQEEHGVFMPALVLLEISSSPTGTVMERKWMSNTQAYLVRPIVSRSLLLINWKNVYHYLNLDSGMTVRDVTPIPQPWAEVGLYPTKNMWTGMTKDTEWYNPWCDFIQRIPRDSLPVVSPGALFFANDSTYILLDYFTESSSQQPQCTPQLSKQQRSWAYRAITRLVTRWTQKE